MYRRMVIWNPTGKHSGNKCKYSEGTAYAVPLLRYEKMKNDN